MNGDRKMWITVGLPGSGKTHWIKNHVLKTGESYYCVWHSRDEVRFRMTKADEDYFVHEKEVFKCWTNEIQKSLDDSSIRTIYADATHLTSRSRKKLLHALDIPEDVEIIWVVFCVPLEVCIRRNARRTGRERVPENVIFKMSRNFTFSINDGNMVIVIDKDGKEVI